MTETTETTDERRSRFTDDVEPQQPWSEYPRPQLRRPDWTSLNGPWDLAITDAGASQPTSFDREILVPYPIGSMLSGVEHTLLPTERAWMRRSVIYDPAQLEGRRLRLHFGGVDWDCTVWCNGHEVGRHRGAHDPWCVDITDALDDHGEQELVLGILDPTDDGDQPVGKQSLLPVFIWYPASAGVWQTVWLEAVPTTAIEQVTTTTDLAAGVATVRVDVSGAAHGAVATVHAFAEGATVASGRGTVDDGAAIVDLTIEDIRAWSPDDPFLHDLRVAVDEDAVESYFGAREVGTVVGDDGFRRLTLNGEPCFNLGMLDQGWWPDGLYTAPTDEALAFDIEAQKAMGFNTIRKHVKVEPARWYWHADRLGMLVWQDMPSTRVDKGELQKAIEAGGELSDADFTVIAPAGDPPGFRSELDAMIDALEPHPSIVVWVPFNEGWGQHDTESTLGHLAQRDPNRLVNGPSGWTDNGEGHIRDHHRYHREADFPGVDPERPVVYGEYGGYTLSVEGHRIDATVFGYGDTAADGVELAERYVALHETLIELRDQGLAGAIYTQTTDVEGEINGLLTYDRVVQKIPNEILAPLHTRLIRR